MATDSRVGIGPKDTCGWSLLRISRIEETNRHPLPYFVEWKLEVTVVRDDDDCSNLSVEDVQQEMGSEVDITALLFAVGDACHEDRAVDVLSAVLYSNGNGRVDNLRPWDAGRLARERPVDQLLRVVAPFHPVIGVLRPQRPQVGVLIGVSCSSLQ